MGGHCRQLGSGSMGLRANEAVICRPTPNRPSGTALYLPLHSPHFSAVPIFITSLAFPEPDGVEAYTLVVVTLSTSGCATGVGAPTLDDSYRPSIHFSRSEMGLNAAAVVVSLVLVVGLIGSSCVAQAPSNAPAPSHKHSKVSPAPPPVREKTPTKGSAPVPSPSVSNSHGAPAPESGASTGSSHAPGASPTGESPAEGPSTGARGVSAGATTKLEKMAVFGAALVGGAAFLV